MVLETEILCAPEASGQYRRIPSANAPSGSPEGRAGVGHLRGPVLLRHQKRGLLETDEERFIRTGFALATMSGYASEKSARRSEE